MKWFFTCWGLVFILLPTTYSIFTFLGIIPHNNGDAALRFNLQLWFLSTTAACLLFLIARMIHNREQRQRSNKNGES